MRASRLLSILMLLQARGRISATELAEQLEVSVRTIYRDVEQLSAAGVPVYAERGRLGGFQLLDGWRTKLTGLTEAEAQAVFLAGLPGPAGELGLTDAMVTAERKLAASLPAGWQADAQRISSRVHLDTVGWYQASDRVEHLGTIAAATWADEVVRIRYESWNGTSERDIRPLGLVIKAGTWYVVATDARPSRTPNEPRTYRISNVLAAAATGVRFRRPAQFDLRAHWDAATREFERELHRERAVIAVTPVGLELLRRINNALATAAGNAGPLRRGRRRVVIPIESVEHATGVLLSLGTDVDVIAPAELRDRIGEIARELAARYA